MAYLGCAVLLPVALVAQNDDRGLLQRTLEDALSDAGRSVQIIGFEGALSSKATVEEITIADDTGVWLTLKSVELDWVRSALLRGRVEVNTLKAAEILLPRLPPAGSGSAPAPEASGFQLPELPVAVNIAEVSAGRVVLGAPVLGVAATLALNGALTLEGGSGAADIVAERIDGARGRFQVDAGFNNATRELRTAISLSEAAGGIAATLIGLPGAPAIDLELLGEAPLSEFEASLALRTDGSDRLAGTVTLGRGSDVDGAPTQTFAADISGDIAPLFLPDYRAFFGPQIALTAAGTRFADGRVSLGALALRAAAVELDGELRLGADGVPVFVDIDGRIAAPDGAPVLLPLAGTPTHVGRADLAVSLDADAGDRWTAGVTVAGLDRPDVRARALALDGRGTITRDGLVATAAEAVFDFRAEALDLASEAAEDALGEAVTGRAEVSWRAAEPLVIRALQLSGETYELSASGQLVTEERDLAISGSAKVAARDLSVVSGLVGRPLSGAAEAELEGEGDLLGGRFSGQLSASTRDMTVDLAELDALTEGDATLRIVAARDETGTRVDSLSIASDHAQISGSGALSSGPGNLTLAAEVRDASRLQPDLSGPLTLSVEAATEIPEGPWQGRVSASGLGADALADGALTLDDVPDYRGALSVEATDLEAFRPLLGRPISGALSLAVDGQMQLDLQLFELAATLTGSDLQTGIGDLDGLLTGPSTASMSARRDGDAFAVDGFQAETGVLVASGNAVIGGAENAVALNGQIKDIAPFVAELSGPVDLVLSATQTDGADWNVDASADGAAGTRVEIGGSVAPDFATTDVAISGLAPLAVADRFIAPRSLAGNARFALRLNGAPGLPALSGTITSEGARFADPAAGIAVEGIAASVRLAAAEAVLDLAGNVRGGGRVSVNGPVALANPNNGSLAVSLQSVVVTDPSLFETSASGTLRVEGPLAGGALIAGRIVLGSTEVQVPSSGFSGTSPIPEIRHIGEPAGVRATRARAGLLASGGNGNGGSDRAYPLNIEIDATNRVFVRGRGLDAELGGVLRVAGTTADIVPDGQFELIRGRLDILGRRLVLTEGRATLRGDLDPDLFLVAETDADEVTVRIEITGKASSPVITFLSEPDLPEDEVLARLLFGRGVESLSVLQAAQLASAVATLAGQGGGGVVSRLRESFGLDDLDVATDETGETSLRVGKYISDNVYTDATVGADGETEIDLNLDLTDSITVRGSVTSEGQTGIGIFVEKDY